MKLEIQYRALDSITERATNPRTHSSEQVAEIVRSITEYGFTNPILIDEGGEIIAGHGRRLAAESMEMAEVPTIELVGLSDEQRRAYVIADNKLALNAGWDSRLLSLDIEALSKVGFDLALTGFSEQELVPYTGQVNGQDFPDLSSTDRPAFQRMAFVLHDDQVALVKQALKVAHKMDDQLTSPNTNRNGNALARIVNLFLEKYVPDDES